MNIDLFLNTIIPQQNGCPSLGDIVQFDNTSGEFKPLFDVISKIDEISMATEDMTAAHLMSLLRKSIPEEIYREFLAKILLSYFGNISVSRFMTNDGTLGSTADHKLLRILTES